MSKLEQISQERWQELRSGDKIGLSYDNSKGFDGGWVVGAVSVIGVPRDGEVLVSLDEIFYQGDNNPRFEKNQILNVRRKHLFDSMAVCSKCRGSGWSDYDLEKCPCCGGSGLEAEFARQN